MRALHLVKTSVGATWALRQMRELVKLGVEVHVALPPNGHLEPHYQRSGVVVHRLQTDFPIGKPWLLRERLGELRALVSSTQPDIIHSHFVGTTLTSRLALGKEKGPPRVFQVPGPLHLEHPFFRKLDMLTAGSKDTWIASCQWTRDCYLNMGVSKSRVFLSYYGVDLDHFAPGARGKLRHELGLGDKTKVIGMVAYVYAPKSYLGQKRGLKGHEDLIDAVAICRRRLPDLKTVFIGGAWNGAIAYERKVREYAMKKCGEQAVFLGTRSDVAQLYPDFDIAVHPSHSENVGGAVESLLSRVPTIATNVGGFPDVVIPGKTGWLVPPRAPEALAETLVEALGDAAHARELASAGREKVSELLDIRQNAREIKKAYETILFGAQVQRHTRR